MVPPAAWASACRAAAPGDSDRPGVTREEEVTASSIFGPAEVDCTQMGQTALSRGSRVSVRVSSFLLPLPSSCNLGCCHSNVGRIG